MRKLEVYTLIALLGLSSASFADQITLKNGDHLTGTVVKSDGKTLVLHTDAGGDITLKFDAIQEMKTDKELHVGVKGGKTVVGPVIATDGKIEVVTPSGGTVEVATADVVVIRNDAEELAWEKAQNPGLKHGWTGGANVGFSVARGNSETENLAVAFNAVHTTAKDKLTLYANSIYTVNNLATPDTVANLVQGGFRFDRNVSARLFAFGAADYMSNALQFLDLRSVYSGGFGFHAIKTAATTLNILGGVNYTHEVYSDGPELLPPTTPPVFSSYGVTNRFVALTLGEELNQKVGKSTVVTENFYMFPDLQQTGQYRGTFNFGTVTKLSKWLGWQNSLSDIYVSNPPSTAKKNDLIITTGLNVSFTH